MSFRFKQTLKVNADTRREFIPLTIRGSAGVIHLTKGLHALVDAEDWDRVASKGKWSAHRGGPRVAAFYARNGREFLHNFIAPPPPGHRWDHKNRNRLDCRKSNLRPATQSRNTVNSVKPNKTGYRGVRKQRQGGYQACIKDRGLGTFPTAEEAARAFDLAARETYGEFAVVNFPGEVG